MYPDIPYTEESITKNINQWRVKKINLENLASNDKKISNQETQIASVNNPPVKNNKLLEYELKYKKQIVKLTRENQLLKAKIQAVKNFYNRQRKELIMKIEGMIYQNTHFKN